MPLCVYYRSIWRFYVSDLAKWVVKLVVRHPDRMRIPSYFDWESRTQRAFFDCGRARGELGWMPASDRQRLIDEGIGGSLETWLAAALLTNLTLRLASCAALRRGVTGSGCTVC